MPKRLIESCYDGFLMSVVLVAMNDDDIAVEEVAVAHAIAANTQGVGVATCDARGCARLARM